MIYNDICDALRDLVPFVRFKNVKSSCGRVLLLVMHHLNLLTKWLYGYHNNHIPNLILIDIK